MSEIRCATYARYSTDKQDAATIDDQRRKCVQYAEQRGWQVLTEHAYSDAAISGAGAERPGFTALMRAALSPERPFNVILVDDTSRLARHQATALQTVEHLQFAGIRLVAVAQGIDSSDEQHDVLLSVHALMDARYCKELAKKTHRGMEGRALRGLHTGGRCFGYDNVRASDGSARLEVNADEAAVVMRIFEMAAGGRSLKRIAATLNAEHVPPPRPRACKQYTTWCPTAIRAMLRREIYAGRIIWNRSKFVKVPGTNRRVRRPRPIGEWINQADQRLRIVSDELWNRVQRHVADAQARYGDRPRRGLLNRAYSSPYLLSGLLRCAECGASLVIVTGRGKGRYPKYGCPQFHSRGACTNNLKERQDFLERALLGGLQEQFLRNDVLDHAVREFRRHVEAAMHEAGCRATEQQGRRATIQAEIARLTEAIAKSGGSDALLSALSEREAELKALGDSVTADVPVSFDTSVDDVRSFIASRLADLPSLLSADTAKARMILGAHLGSVRMVPEGEGKNRHYVAEGRWNLLGREELAQTRQPLDRRVWMVAGARFELATFGL